ncbi:MAG: hypothetical protein ACXWEO_01990 [Methylobacter sp.]
MMLFLSAKARRTNIAGTEARAERDNKTIRGDVQVVTATNRNLAEEASLERFRLICIQDLYRL